MKKLSIIIGLIAVSFSLEAQNYIDVLRYSRMQYLGTARFNAMGGSFGALGGDASSLLTNPAGIGVYRNSEFTFTPSFYISDNESTFRGTFREDGKVNFNIGNISYIGSYKGSQNGWKNYSFGFGHNRVSSFHGEQRISGSNNTGSSIIDDYVYRLNQAEADILAVENYEYSFGPSEAYWLYLIDPSQNEVNQYQRAVVNASTIDQNEKISTSGKQAETYFSFGGNYQDKFYLGGTFSVQNTFFEQEREFSETYIYTPAATPTDSLAVGYTERTNLIVNGLGATAKIGAIYQPKAGIRLGGAIHLPTFFNFREEYSFKPSSEFSDGEIIEESESFTNWEYNIRTPWRYMGSIAYVYKNIAAINFEYEYVDYSTAKLDDRNGFDYDYAQANQDIREVLAGTHNIRVGAEYRLEPFVIRGGLRYEDNPFNSGELFLNPDQIRKTYSLGTGFRSKNYNIDVTYMFSEMQSIDPVYTFSDASATIDDKVHRLIFTVGWKW